MKWIVFLVVMTTNLRGVCQNFNISLFRKELSSEMKKEFPYMELDTSISYTLSPDFKGYYPGRQSGKIEYVNPEDNEHIMAVTAVKKYKEFLMSTIFTNEENIKNCKFRWYSIYVDWSGHIIRYGLMIDNRLDPSKCVIDLD